MIAIIWLIWGRHLPDATHSSGLLKQIYEVSKSTGKPATIGAVSFIAYLIGVLSVALSDWLTRFPNKWRESLANNLYRGKLTEGLGLRLLRTEDRVRRALRFAISARMKSVHVEHFLSSMIKADSMDDFASELRSKMRHPSQNNKIIYRVLGSPTVEATLDEEDRYELFQEVRNAVTNHLLSNLLDDLPLVPARLLGRDADLYDAYDRLRAEAQFRAAVALPLIPFAITLSLAARSAVYLLLLPMAFILLLTAFQRRRESEYMLAESIYANRVKTPVLEILDMIASNDREVIREEVEPSE
jgi:hypothetical protein